MKIKDVLEADVIDLGSRRVRKKQSEFMDKLRGVSNKVRNHFKREKEANEEFARFHKWAEELKHRVKLFGFETLNDAFYFLVVDAQMPHWTPRKPAEMKPGQEASHPAHVGQVKAAQDKIRMWYRRLNQVDKKKFLTIHNNADRIREVLTTVRNELRKLQDRWRDIKQKEGLAAPLGIFQSTTYVDTEIRNDLEYLDRVEDVAHIIGL